MRLLLIRKSVYWCANLRNSEGYHACTADATGKRGLAVQSQEESVREILKGIEGLEMLSQWELSLTRDLRAKAEALLRSAREGGKDTGPASDPPG
jgi:hypothetical protein